MTLCDNRQMPLYAVAAVFVEDEHGQVALQLRDDIPTIRWPNHWSLWGGQVEPGETPLAAAARELGEELTLAVPEEALTLVCEHVRGEGTPFHADWRLYRYRAGKALADAVVMEGQGLGRFDVSVLTDETLDGRPVHPVIREVLADYLRARGAQP
jgi:8-oxo-dGTP diphosphatase